VSQDEKTKIALLIGGSPSLRDVSLEAASVIEGSIDKSKYDVKKIVIDEKGRWIVNDYPKNAALALKGVNVVINTLHGEYSDVAPIQTTIERMQIPYTGSTSLAATMAIDKLASRLLFRQNGLVVPTTLNFDFRKILDFKSVQREITSYFNLPVVIKPNSKGFSFGVGIVKDAADIPEAIRYAAGFDKIILVEEFLRGLEVSCMVVETRSGLVGLPPVVLMPVFKKQASSSFDIPETKDAKLNIAHLDEEIIKRIKTVAVYIHKLLGLRHYSKTDFILIKDKLYVLEVNPFPAFTKNSLALKAINWWGIDLNKFLDHLIDLTLNPQKEDNFSNVRLAL